MTINENLKKRIDKILEDSTRHLMEEHILNDSVQSKSSDTLEQMQKNVTFVGPYREHNLYKVAFECVSTCGKDIENTEELLQDERFSALFDFVKDNNLEPNLLGLYIALTTPEKFHQRFSDVLDNYSDYKAWVGNNRNSNEIKKNKIDDQINLFWNYLSCVLEDELGNACSKNIDDVLGIIFDRVIDNELSKLAFDLKTQISSEHDNNTMVDNRVKEFIDNVGIKLREKLKGTCGKNTEKITNTTIKLINESIVGNSEEIKRLIQEGRLKPLNPNPVNVTKGNYERTKILVEKDKDCLFQLIDSKLLNKKAKKQTGSKVKKIGEMPSTPQNK